MTQERQKTLNDITARPLLVKALTDIFDYVIEQQENTFCIDEQLRFTVIVITPDVLTASIIKPTPDVVRARRAAVAATDKIADFVARFPYLPGDPFLTEFSCPDKLSINVVKLFAIRAYNMALKKNVSFDSSALSDSVTKYCSGQRPDPKSADVFCLGRLISLYKNRLCGADGCGDAFDSLINGMTALDPFKRLSAKDAKAAFLSVMQSQKISQPPPQPVPQNIPQPPQPVPQPELAPPTQIVFIEQAVQESNTTVFTEVAAFLKEHGIPLQLYPGPLGDVIAEMAAKSGMSTENGSILAVVSNQANADALNQKFDWGVRVLYLHAGLLTKYAIINELRLPQPAKPAIPAQQQRLASVIVPAEPVKPAQQPRPPPAMPELRLPTMPESRQPRPLPVTLPAKPAQQTQSAPVILPTMPAMPESRVPTKSAHPRPVISPATPMSRPQWPQHTSLPATSRPVILSPSPQPQPVILPQQPSHSLFLSPQALQIAERIVAEMGKTPAYRARRRSRTRSRSKSKPNRRSKSKSKPRSRSKSKSRSKARRRARR